MSQSAVYQRAHTTRYVVKRDGERQALSFDKILNRIDALCEPMGGEQALNVDASLVAQKVITYFRDGITTSDLDKLAAETAAAMAVSNPIYGRLAARIAVSNLHKSTSADFVKVMQSLRDNTLHGVSKPIVSDALFAAAEWLAPTIANVINYDRDYSFDYFGYCTLEKSYLLRLGSKVVERPQHMYMRVALGIHLKDDPSDIDAEVVMDTYNLLSTHMYTHATPTLFNAGTIRPQLASCFLLTVKEDSLEGIYSTISDCAIISKNSGGIGVALHNVRAKGSPISGSNGKSNGLVPMIRVFEATARYVDQCFPSTLGVHTTRGLVPFPALKPHTDAVYTSSQSSSKLAKIICHHDVDKGLVRIHLVGSPQPLYITEEHQMLTVSHPAPIVALREGLVKMQYCTAFEIAVGDFAVFPVPKLGATNPEHGRLAKFVGMCLHLSDGMDDAANTLYAKFRRGQHTSVINLNTEAHNIGARVINKYHGEDQHLHVCVEQVPSVVYRLVKMVVDTLTEVDVEFWFGCLLGILEVADSLDVREEYLRVDGPDASLLQTIALRAGEVVFADTCGRVVHVLWSPKLLRWARWLGISTGEERVVVQSMQGYRLVPITRVTVDPAVMHPTLHDLELEEDPHDYVTEYGVVHNGGGKRKGAFAMYLEPWHPDIIDFLHMKRNGGDENSKARDLFYALWVPDLFMKRVRDNAEWSLFNPSEILPVCLHQLTGKDFEREYLRLEGLGKAFKTVQATDIWKLVLESQMETGVPYIMYKDACNLKSNQQNLGVIQCSNLCTEIVEYSAPDEIAVCNLASIALPKFVEDDTFNYQKLRMLVRKITRNMNAVIDASYYPLDAMRHSNMRHRPIGLGVQGLADVFFMLHLPFDSDAAKAINRRIFKFIYYAAVEESCALARVHGPYSTFAGSPASQGKLQPHLWGVELDTPEDEMLGLDWAALTADVVKHGMRNSLLVAPMPTASTAQIMGNVECFEPQTSNIYTRRVLSGEFVVLNKHLVKCLERRGLWNERIRQAIIRAGGSVNVPDMPSDIKDVYKTVWEIKQRDIVDMAADRGPYIDQSHSLNIHFAQPDAPKLHSLHMYAWRRGLKTSSYYLRSQPGAIPTQSTAKAAQRMVEPAIDQSRLMQDLPQQSVVCTDEVCTMCSS